MLTRREKQVLFEVIDEAIWDVESMGQVYDSILENDDSSEDLVLKSGADYCKSRGKDLREIRWKLSEALLL